MADHSVDQNDLFDLMPQVIPLNKKPIEKQNKKASDIIPFAFDHGTKNSSNSIVTIRELVSKDLEEFKSLHEEWFPIRYNQVCSILIILIFGCIY
jgi:hypothetical protein